MMIHAEGYATVSCVLLFDRATLCPLGGLQLPVDGKTNKGRNVHYIVHLLSVALQRTHTHTTARHYSHLYQQPRHCLARPGTQQQRDMCWYVDVEAEFHLELQCRSRPTMSPGCPGGPGAPPIPGRPLSPDWPLSPLIPCRGKMKTYGHIQNVRWSHVSESVPYHPRWTGRSWWSSWTCGTLRRGGSKGTRDLRPTYSNMKSSHMNETEGAVNLQCGRRVRAVPGLPGCRDHPGKVTNHFKSTLYYFMSTSSGLECRL